MDFLELAKRKQDEYLEDLNKLVSIESTRDDSTACKNAPFGTNCRKALDAMLEIAQSDGFKTEDIDGYAGVVEYGQGEESFGIVGHLDIVPLGEGWTKDPLKVTYSDGYIFGRGTMDDKGPVMAAYYALKLIRENNIQLNKRVRLMFGCDEESHMECMKYYKEHAEVPSAGFSPDANFPVVYGEKGGLHVILRSKDHTVIKKLNAGTRPNIVIGKADAYVEAITEKQMAEFEYYLKVNGIDGAITKEDGLYKIHVEGLSSHAAWPYHGNNAAVHLFNYIGSSFDDQLAKDLYFMTKDWMGKQLGIHYEGTYMTCLTLSTGIIRMEQDDTMVYLDIRYPNDTTGDEVVAKITKAADGLASNIEVCNESDSKPLFVDPSSKLVTELMDVYVKYTKDTFHPAMTIGGGTYARMFDNFVSFGPEKPWEEVETDQIVGGCHQADEGIKLSTLIEAIAIYAEAIVALCA